MYHIQDLQESSTLRAAGSMRKKTVEAIHFRITHINGKQKNKYRACPPTIGGQAFILMLEKSLEEMSQTTLSV
jgi:hypothetical protein